MVQRTQPGVLPGEAHLLREPRDRGGEVTHVDRLGEKILGAELHGADGGLDVALPGQQYDRGAVATQPLEYDQAVRIGKMQVEQNDVGPDALERVDRLPAGAFAPHLVADALEILADRAQHAWVVIDEQQRISHGVPRPLETPIRPIP